MDNQQPKQAPPIPINCNVEKFLPKSQQQGLIKTAYYVVELLAFVEETKQLVIVPDQLKRQFDTRCRVVSGTDKGKLFVVDPANFAACYDLKFNDGVYTIIPDFAVLGEITE